MKIGILGAMQEEVSSIKKLMKVYKITTLADRDYFEGKINHIDVVLTFSRWGKVASATTTTTLINTFNVDFVVFTGVAGAVHEDLNIGDIVIGSALYQHDLDARPFYHQYQIPLTEHILLKPRQSDIQRAFWASSHLIESMESIFSRSLLEQYSMTKPKVYVGTIASGDQFISMFTKPKDGPVIEEGETLAVEMEGASVAQVCLEHQMPYIVIRTISDRADHSAAIDFQSFIRDIAALYSSEIVRRLIPSLSIPNHLEQAVISID